MAMRQVFRPMLVALLFSGTLGIPLCPAAQIHAMRVPLLMSEELDEHGAVIPLAPEILRLLHYLEHATHLRFDIHRYPWKRALETSVNGEGVIFGISKTSERLRELTFSEPVYKDQTFLISLCESRFDYHTVTDLKGKTIGIVRGTSYGEEFDRLSHTLFQVEDDTSNNPGRFMKLLQHRMDAFLLYSPTLNTGKLQSSINQRYAGLSGKNSEEAIFCVSPHAVSAVDIHFAARHGLYHDVLQKINRAVLHARHNGDLMRIFSPDTQLPE
ncbi:MAG: transporter substrate-binding domain-containing protein [Burkholderiales bacterium]|nr:transporter substrate-binding domain-containing protein [Burkholderiales bacterium]